MEVSHEAIYERINQAEGRIVESERRVMTLVKWLAGGFAAAAFSALTWGVQERQSQIQTNAQNAQAYGTSLARQEEIKERLDSLGQLITSESQLTREKITAHVSDKNAHGRK